MCRLLRLRKLILHRGNTWIQPRDYRQRKIQGTQTITTFGSMTLTVSSLSWDEFTRFISVQEADLFFFLLKTLHVCWTLTSTNKDMANSFTVLEMKRIQLVSVHFHLSRGLLIFHIIIFYYYCSGSCQVDTVGCSLRVEHFQCGPNVMICLLFL